VILGTYEVGGAVAEILSTTQDKPQISDDGFVKILQTAVAKLNR
jgi:hypothetical protein